MRVLPDLAAADADHDVLVIGAGPAGLAAASTAAGLGLSTLLVDENPYPGGQIYRGITTTPLVNRATLGPDYWRGADLVRALDASPAHYLAAAAAWSVTPSVDEGGTAGGLEIGLSSGGVARLVRARQVIAATGALERPFPIPGWTLPGVMTAGAAQIALKTAGLVPDGRVVMAGCGPLLYLLAAQLRAAGAPIAALLDTTPRANWAGAARHAAAFATSPYAAKGAALLLGALRGLRVVRGVDELEAEGDGQVAAVRFRRRGVVERLDCDLLLLHQGVVPGTALADAAGATHRWDGDQLAFVPEVDDWFETTVAGLAVPGDGAEIAGAEAAAPSGALAALGAAARLGHIDVGERDARAAAPRRDLARSRRGRAFLDALFRPGKAFRVPPRDDAVVCRCEEVTAGAIRDAVKLGATGPNQVKSFLRCGMGPCQGRECGLTLTEVIADALGAAPEAVGKLRARPPVKPVTLAELAALPITPAARHAVER